ncbi:MAG: flavodoxin family protein [Eubacteriales bacterium]|nr:flavodoxin family protein [Eubacteriales bacterium]
MKYAIVYSSVTGNTERLAAALREFLPGEECVYYGAASTEKLPDAELFLLGFWTDKGTCDENMAAYMQQLQGKKVFLFGTAGFGGSEDYFHTILSNVLGQLPSSNTLLGTYMCQGQMPDSIGKRYEKMTQDNPDDARAASMLLNYRQGIGRPDEKDIAELEKIIEELFS